MSILLNVTHDENEIKFIDEGNGVYGYTTYTNEVWEKIKNLNWYVNEKEIEKRKKTYIYTGSTKFNGHTKLHQIVMFIWYGETELEEAYKNNFIVEHHDNNAFNCLIENLSFAPNNVNLAKAHLYDKERPQLINDVAVNIFKDFNTRKYQITLAFNQPFLFTEGSKKTLLEKMYLLYDDNFRLVYTDASRIVSDLLETDSLDFTLLRPKKREIVPAMLVFTDKEHDLSGIRFINGEPVVFLNNDPKYFLRIDSASPKKSLYTEDEAEAEI